MLERSSKIDYYNETCLFDEIFDYSRKYIGGYCEYNFTNGETDIGSCTPYFQCDKFKNSYMTTKITYFRLNQLYVDIIAVFRWFAVHQAMKSMIICHKL